MESLRRLWIRLRVIARHMRPQHLLALGFFSYVVLGFGALSLPFAQTGSTVSTGDDYTVFGQVVILLLFQVGSLGYMTLSSFIILARRNKLPQGMEKLLAAQFTLPQDFQIAGFLKHVVIFALVIETLGAIALYIEFRAMDVANPAWQAVFHSVSAFATAGFSLNNTSLEAFRGSVIVNATISVLCYAGGLGFIVILDAWRRVTRKDYRLTFTSRVILVFTFAVLVALSPLIGLIDPSLAALPIEERWLAATFQIMTASTTAGFNTVPIGALAPSTLLLITLVMIIGASPSGTGGGVKTTTVSALFAICRSTLRGEPAPTLWGKPIPVERLHTAVTSTSLYLGTLAAGIFAIGFSQGGISLDLIFECASALGTVGLSMGITADLTPVSRLVITALMFLGRLGPLTAGFAFVSRREESAPHAEPADLSV
jgi:trk system potassium uptake protein TrkH